MAESTLHSRTATGPESATPQSCRFCGGPSEPALVAWDRNRALSQERFAYRRCRRCATLFLAQPPADLDRYYGAGYHGFDADGEPQWRHDPLLQRGESARVHLIRRYVEPGELIEIGSGAGGFANAATAAGFSLTAIEMDADCCRYLHERLGARAIHSDQPVQALEQLDPVPAVAMWHVLEHLPNPYEALSAVARKLRPGGVLALGVPNAEAIQFRLLGTRWAHLDAPRHLSLIPADALIESARGLGLSPLLVTTSDPFGRHCNAHGWSCALVSRPSDGIPRPAQYAALALTRMLAPIERRGRRGSALLILLRKAPAA